MNHKRSTALERSVKIFSWGGGGGGLNQFNVAPTSPLVQMWIKIHRCLVCMKTPNLSMQHLLEHINQDIKTTYIILKKEFMSRRQSIKQ